MALLSNKESGYFNTFTEDISSESKSYTLDEVKTLFNLKFNVLVADCEGFMETLFDKNPELYEELDLIIYERDNNCKSGGDRLFCDYEKYEGAIAYPPGMKHIQKEYHKLGTMGWIIC